MCFKIFTGANGYMTSTSELIFACNVDSNPDLDRIRQIIHEGTADLNYSDFYHGTPLQDACRHGHASVVQLLLQQPGIDVAKKAPLSMACFKGHLSVVQLLLQHPGIDINQASAEHGVTSLYNACCYGHESVVQLLLQQPGIRINQARDTGITPLMAASQNGHESVVQLMLQQL